MNIEEILDCIDCAMMELDYVDIEDLPENLHEDFIQTYNLLLHIGSVLDLEMEEIEPNPKNLEGLKLLIEQWAIDRNLHTADSSKQALKLGEEYGELCEGLSKGKPELIKDALGDMFVVMTILAMQEDLDFTECVEIAYNEIKDRKGEMKNGIYVKEADL